MHTHLGDNTYYHVTVPEFIMEPIRDEVFNTESWDGREYQDRLAGNIKDEFLLQDCYEDVKHYIENVARKYKGGSYKLADLWVNFMAKHEFNPPHSHGGDLSFVIFVKVPYKSCDEEKIFPDASAPCAGMFHFMYSDIFGHISCEQIPVDMTYENDMFMFPAKLKHGVFPFYTSDEYRITVAGNLVLDNS